MAEQHSGERESIHLHLRELRQLFDSFDPSPFYEKDLDSNAEEYIADSLRELRSRRPPVLKIYLDSPNAFEDGGEVAGRAIREHFARRSRVLREELRQLLRRGWISLTIGVSFLVTFFFVAQLVAKILGGSQWAQLARKGLVIGGWVAMWRPLEIFLYDWWPLVGKRRMYDRLSQMKVETVQCDATSDNV